MIERIVYANADNQDVPIHIGEGPDGLAEPKLSVCISTGMPEVYIDKEQWKEVVRAVQQWFDDAEATDA